MALSELTCGEWVGSSSEGGKSWMDLLNLSDVEISMVFAPAQGSFGFDDQEVQEVSSSDTSQESLESLIDELDKLTRPDQMDIVGKEELIGKKESGLLFIPDSSEGLKFMESKALAQVSSDKSYLVFASESNINQRSNLDTCSGSTGVCHPHPRKTVLKCDVCASEFCCESDFIIHEALAHANIEDLVHHATYSMDEDPVN